MELPKIKRPERGMLDGIKSKLGFSDVGNNDHEEEYYDDYQDYGGNAAYDEFGEYGPEYDNAAPSSRYEPYAPVTTRSNRGRHSSRNAGSDSDFPKLVSIDDVRANTQVPDSLRRDPLPQRRVTSTPGAGSSRGYGLERTVINEAMPAPSSPAHTAARRERSESLNSLFGSGGPEDAVGASFEGSGQGKESFGSFDQQGSAPLSAQKADSFDPYEAYAGSKSVAHSPSRSISVLKPANYGEVERVAKILKAGDAVVLSLKNTPDQLSKRILDFSFGVSSALDASVECVSDKVFAITRVTALTEAERLALRNQGVL